MRSWQPLTLLLLALAGTLVLFEFTDIDRLVENHFYDRQSGKWVVDEKAPLPRAIFYTGPKAVLIGFGTGCAAVFAGSFLRSGLGRTLKRYRRPCLLMALALSLIPSLMAVLKETTNIYTPRQTSRYGGSKPYVKLFQPRPRQYQDPGKGWPAGHSSPGFALMMLYFALPSRRGKALGLVLGLSVGWIMGGYQMLKGAHYLSHTIVAMLLAGVMIVLIHDAVEWGFRRLGDRVERSPAGRGK